MMVRTNSIAALILLIFVDNPYTFFPSLFVFIVINYVGFCLGVLINSYADREADLAVGRDHFKNFSKTFRGSILALLSFFVLFIPLYFKSVWIVGIVAVGLLLTILYSIKPIRFKERGWMGLAMASITETISFSFFFFLIPGNITLIFYIMGWLLLLSLIMELINQLNDYDSDSTTRTKTFAVRMGIPTTTYVLRRVLGLLLLYIMCAPLLFPRLNGLLLSLLLFTFSHIHVRNAQQQIHLMAQRK